MFKDRTKKKRFKTESGKRKRKHQGNDRRKWKLNFHPGSDSIRRRNNKLIYSCFLCRTSIKYSSRIIFFPRTNFRFPFNSLPFHVNSNIFPSRCAEACLGGCRALHETGEQITTQWKFHLISSRRIKKWFINIPDIDSNDLSLRLRFSAIDLCRNITLRELKSPLVLSVSLKKKKTMKLFLLLFRSHVQEKQIERKRMKAKD